MTAAQGGAPADRLAPLDAFVAAFGRLLDAAPGEPAIRRDGAALLRALG